MGLWNDNSLKSRILILLLVLVMVCGGCGNANQADTEKDAANVETEQEEGQEEEQKEKSQGSTDTDQSASAASAPEYVDIVIPEFMTDGEPITFEEDEMIEYGIVDYTNNDDGSVSIKMTKEGARNYHNSIKETIDQGFQEMVEDQENYPSFRELSYNDNVTEFEVKVDGSSFGGFESFASFAFYMEGAIYQSIQGVPIEDVKVVVNYVDESTGEVLETFDSTEMEDTEE